MTAAVTASDAAIYIAQTADIPAASSQDGSTQSSQTSSTSTPAAAPPAPSSVNLAPSTIASLVAQQAMDSGSASGSNTASSSAPTSSAASYTNNALANGGPAGSVVAQAQIRSFDNLAADQQQTLVDQINQTAANGKAGNGTPAFASVASYRSYLEAQLGVQSFLESALSTGALTQAQLADPSSIQDTRLAAIAQAATSDDVGDAWTAQGQAVINAGLPSSAVSNAVPATVIANMKSFATTAPTQFTDQINTYSATLADGSAASVSDKLQAWLGLTKLLTSGAIYNAGNVADLQKAYGAANGPFQQQVIGVEDKFSAATKLLAAPAQAAGQLPNGYQNQLTALNQFSSSDQQILLATMSAAGSPQGFSNMEWQAYDSVDDWKAALQKEAAAFSAQNPASTALDSLASALAAASTPPSTTVNAAADAAKAVLPASTSNASTATDSDVALSLLKKGAAQWAKYQTDSASGSSTAQSNKSGRGAWTAGSQQAPAQKPHSVGSRVSATA